jgi:hypothetical protein
MTVPKETLDKIKSYLCGHGFLVLNYFTNDGRSVFVFADPSYVDQILVQEELTVPPVGPDKLHVMCACQIKVENAYELVITGIANYDSSLTLLAGCGTTSLMVRQLAFGKAKHVHTSQTPSSSLCVIGNPLQWSSMPTSVECSDGNMS